MGIFHCHRSTSAEGAIDSLRKPISGAPSGAGGFSKESSIHLCIHIYIYIYIYVHTYKLKIDLDTVITYIFNLLEVLLFSYCILYIVIVYYIRSNL